MAIGWSWIQGTSGDVPQYPAKEDRRVLSAMWDEGVLAGGVITANGTDRTLSLAVGAKAVIDGDHGVDQGSYLAVVHTAAATVTIDAAPGSGSRIDLVGLRVRDLDEGGDAGNDIIIDKVTGVASGSPSPPATPSSFLVLATITISAGQVAVSQGMVTDARVYSGPKDAIGVVKSFAGPSNAVPAGWEILQGQSWSSAGGHDALAARLGLTLPTTAPDARGRVLRGVAASGTGSTLRGAFGNDTVTLGIANIPAHSHSINHDHASATSGATAHSHTVNDPGHAHGTGSGNRFVVGNDVPGSALQIAAGAGTTTQQLLVAASFTSISIPSSGSHTHTVDIANFTGTSGDEGWGDPTTIIPAGLAVYHIIRIR